MNKRARATKCLKIRSDWVELGSSTSYEMLCRAVQNVRIKKYTLSNQHFNAIILCPCKFLQNQNPLRTTLMLKSTTELIFTVIKKNHFGAPSLSSTLANKQLNGVPNASLPASWRIHDLLPWKLNHYTCEVRTPVFTKGSLEYSIKFIVAPKQAIPRTNLYAKISDACREFKHHTKDRSLNMFNKKTK